MNMLKVWRTFCTLCMIVFAAMTLLSITQGYDYWYSLTLYWVSALVRDVLGIILEVYAKGGYINGNHS